MKTNDTQESNTPIRRSVGDVCLASCQKLLAQLENVRAAITSEFRDGLAEHEHLLHLAMNEAEALAWETGFPQLFLPALATEKVRAVATWQAHQKSVRRSKSPPAVTA